MIKRFLKITIASLVLLSMVAFVLFSSFEAKADGSFSGGGSSTDESGDTVYTLNDGGRLDYSETTGSFNYVTFKFRPNSYMGGDDQAHLTLYISSGSSIVSFRLLNYWKALDIVDYAQDYSSSTKLMEFANYANNGGGGWTQTDAWVDVKIGFNVNGFYYSVGGTEFFIPNNNHYDLSNKAIWFGCWSCTPSFKDFTLSNNDEWHANAWRGNCDVALEDDKPVYTVNTGGVNRINYLGLTHADTVEFKVKYPADYAGDTTNLSFYVANGTETMRIYTFPFYNYFQVEKYNADASVCTLQGISGNYTNAGTHGVWDPVNEWLTIKIEFANKHTAVYLNSVKVFETCANYGFDYTNTNFFFTAWGCLLSIKDIVLSDNSLQPSHTPVEDAAVPATCTTAGKTAGSHCSACNEVLVPQEDIEALGHLEVIDNAVAATCTTAGKTEGKHCSRCSEVLVPQEDIEALGHLEVIDNAVAATCTTAGKTEGKHCSRCSEVLVPQEDIEALGHAPVADPAVAATCTTAGKTEGKHCSRCSEVLVPQEDIEALGHAPVADPAVAATCTEKGKTAGSHCSRCSAVLEAQEDIAALGHNESSQTYHTNDKHFNICTRCGFALDFEDQTVQTDYTDARWTQRKYTSDWVAMSGQMRVREKNGSKVVNMAAGYSTTMQYILNFGGSTPIAKGNSFSIDLGNYFGGAKPMGVKISLVVKVASTTQTIYVLGSADSYYNFHVTTGFETFTYVGNMEVEIYEIRITNNSQNNGSFYLYMDNLRIFTAMNTADHTMVDDPSAPAQAATCTQAGKEVGKMCSCGYKVEGSSIPANGHTEVIDAAVAPTCTETGLTQGKHCSVCNEVLVAQQEVAALGHTEVIDAAVAATCTETGLTQGKHCSVCNEVLVAQQEVAALGHDLVDDAAVAPTCTEAGKTAGHHCSRCDYKDGGEVVAATGHDWGEWVQTKAPSATEEGEEKRTCKNDPNHTETRPIDRTPVITTTEEPAPVTTTEAPAPETTTKTPVTEAPAPVKKGCKGALVPSIIGVVLLLGSIVVIKRKREE